MTPEELRGKWNQIKGTIKQKWGKLTDDDLAKIAGGRDKLVGTLQERYGITKREAERKVDEFTGSE